MSLVEPRYQDYSCSQNAPLNCEQLKLTAEQFPKAKFCLECGFPAILPEKAEIKGSRGTYQVTKFLGSRGMGRLYLGIKIDDSQPVVIKEYLLPSRSFNTEEASQRQETFVRVAGVSSVDGKNQDFRLITPYEAIADRQGDRCYTITIGNLEASQTLSQYLREKAAMKGEQVREVLSQALQTLQFLHSQKFRLPSGQVRQDLIHGHISLDSLLIVQNNPQSSTIYLCDLAVWERLFEPPLAQSSISSVPLDLNDLGRVAFYLWVGRAVNSSSQPLDPRDTQQWPSSDPELKQFIYRLIGLETPFESAEEARQALLQLKKEKQADSAATIVNTEQKEKGFRIPLILLGLLVLSLLCGGIWYILSKYLPKVNEESSEFDQLVRTFTDVNGVPSGNFTYTGEKQGTWSNILTFRLSSNKNLQDLLTKPNEQITAEFNYHPVSSPDITKGSEPIKSLLKGNQLKENQSTDFTMTSLEDQVTGDLDKRKIAYDGLLVFVPFSKKDQNLPKALHGQISLEQLSQIYTGQVTYWDENKLGGPHILIKPLAPTEPEAEIQFQKIVLHNDEQKIAEYKKTVYPPQSTEETQQQIVTQFDEEKVGIISYGILSKTWNQCAGYPLAISNDEKSAASQALFRLNNQPINPSDNICDKRNRLDVGTFVNGLYPLGYPLFVIYRKDNSTKPAGYKFAEILKTRQGQCLLSKAGLVPLQYIPDNYLNSNDCESVPQP
ncbi:MAG: substrate-binding domain-containing protein [Rhizonema sp. PD37]|nr:substrate-binding domain-containing protein [Rhizonema sp. PD37]